MNHNEVQFYSKKEKLVLFKKFFTFTRNNAK